MRRAAKQSVIVLGANAALRVRQGGLEIEHGPAAERVKLKIDIDDRPPCAILFDGRGEFLSGEAIAMVRATRRRHRHAGRAGPRAHIHRNCAGGAIRETLRDVGPALIRAQCAADPVQVAREIVRAKIAADAKGLGPRVTERDLSTIARCKAKLAAARSVAEIVVIEAKAACVYWRSWRDFGVDRAQGRMICRAHGGASPTAIKGAEFLGNKHASHPISAMINYCVVVEAGRLARALAG